MMPIRDEMRERATKGAAGSLGIGIRRSAGTLSGWRRGLGSMLVLLWLPLVGCVTQGDFLRLEEKVAQYHRPGVEGPDPFTRIAQLSADVEALRQEVRDLQGQLELASKRSSDALAQAELARTAVVQGAAPEAPTEPGAEAEGGDESAAGPGAVSGAAEPSGSRDEELQGYQQALDAWRKEEFDACIDRFTAFLQRYPASGYADDAAYWLADCHYKKGEYKQAALRFHAVVSVYPESPKAPDALYRQGESLLKLGPRFHEAARTVFERVRSDYPDSDRARESAEQLERLGPRRAAG